jgi:hypothetical protein
VGEGWSRAVRTIVRKIKKYYVRVEEKNNILRTITRRKSNWIGHIWLRNCFIKHVIDGKVEEMRRQRRRSKQLLNDLKETTRYWKLQEEALDRSMLGTHVEKGCGLLYRLSTL